MATKNLSTIPPQPEVPQAQQPEESESKTFLTDSLNSLALLQRLRSAGVYLRTAQRLLARHEPSAIDRHLAYYTHALQTGIARGPGWLVLSITEGWPAPPGYAETHRDSEEGRRRYVEGEYADWIHRE